MKNNAIDIAQYIITYCNRKNDPISNLKLQKMLYYVWIEYYKSLQKILFGDRICAWPLGPVVPSVYYEYCTFGGMPIDREYKEQLTGIDKNVLDASIDKYRPMSVTKLVNNSHESGNPWDIVYSGGIGNRDEIPFDLIVDKECQGSGRAADRS